jgi:hypothetical protein
MPRFKLTIDLGNEAMQTGEDVAALLLEAADDLRDHGPAVITDRDACGVALRDPNGNTVGSWQIESDAARRARERS